MVRIDYKVVNLIIFYQNLDGVALLRIKVLASIFFPQFVYYNSMKNFAIATYFSS